MTAWERDKRPNQPCVVCSGIPDRTVELPQLPSVHRAFGSTALCAMCATAATGNNVAELTRRARLGWLDEDDPVDDAVGDVVSLVLAAFGHRPRDRTPPPPEFRDPDPALLSSEDAATWRQLEPLIYDGPGYDVVVRGRISYECRDDRRIIAAHRAGPRARLDDADGTPLLITDGVNTWYPWPEGMVRAPHDRDSRLSGEGTDLAFRRQRYEIELFGFGRPIGPIESTEYLGRPAWRFAFAAPAHKPFDMQIIVDAETGFALEKRFGEHSVARWLEFVTDEPVDPALFHWDGPAIAMDEARARRDREHEQDMAARTAWFAEHVTAQPLTFGGRPVRVLLHEWAPDGSCSASFSGGLHAVLARRLRSREWWNTGMPHVTHRWSDERWDWALSAWSDDDEPLDADALAAFRRALCG